MKPRCKICGHQVQTLVDSQFDLDYFLCLNCEYCFQTHSAYLSPEEEKALYLIHENDAQNKAYMARFRHMIENYLLPVTDHNRSVLDYGSGPAPVLAKLLETHGFQVDIYDPYFAPSTCFREKQVDLITCTEVVEHLKDPVSVFQELASILNPGGRLAISTQFHSMNDRDFLNWRYRRDPTHIGFFRKRTFEVLAAFTNLKLLSCDEVSFCLLSK